MQQMHHTNRHPSSSVTPWAPILSPNAPPPPAGPFGAYEKMADLSMMGHMAMPEISDASQGLVPGLGFPNPLQNPRNSGYSHSLGHQNENDQTETTVEEPERKRRR